MNLQNRNWLIDFEIKFMVFKGEMWAEEWQIRRLELTNAHYYVWNRLQNPRFL